MIHYTESDFEKIFICDDDVFIDDLTNIEIILNDFIKTDKRDAVIDMAGVNRINSKVIAFFIKTKDKISNDGRSLTLVNTNEAVTNVITIAGLQSYLLG